MGRESFISDKLVYMSDRFRQKQPEIPAAKTETPAAEQDLFSRNEIAEKLTRELAAAERKIAELHQATEALEELKKQLSALKDGVPASVSFSVWPLFWAVIGCSLALITTLIYLFL